MHISAAFDSGNIEVDQASDPSDVQLRIRPDAGGDHMQWFHFRVAGARDVPLTLRILNASACSYPLAWSGYQAVASTDRAHWRRVPTSYQDGQLVIRHTPSADLCEYAYFAPYSHEQHLQLVARCQQATGARVSVVGRSVDGLDLERVQVGTGERTLWVIARQHPGESMAEWWMEGFLQRLLDPSDALAQALRSRATFHVVPNMNPDGSRRGHLRNNAAGMNLNRVWHAPDERSPEVRCVLAAMDDTGVDLCLDVHGDEELPYNFLSGAEGIRGWSSRLADLQSRFAAAYERANPHLQRVHGYPVAAPGAANLTMCTNQVAQRFDCLALTLEQPFKDDANAPDPEFGWSPARAKRLGASALDAMAEVVDGLR
ncbi:MAG: hypothetical protein KTR31_25185 [Myxococcales bacterium]|nr:hypothetical protein [Myxococcales bacterium]